MVALGDDLGADQHIVAALDHRIGEFGGGTWPGQEIADHQRDARLGKTRRDLLVEALDPRAARHQRSGGETFRADRRNRRGIAAMVADQAASKAMLDQPGGAVRTLKPVAAGAAQGQGRVAAAVQEQQRLLAGREGLAQCHDQGR